MKRIATTMTSINDLINDGIRMCFADQDVVIYDDWKVTFEEMARVNNDQVHPVCLFECIQHIINTTFPAIGKPMIIKSVRDEIDTYRLNTRCSQSGDKPFECRMFCHTCSFKNKFSSESRKGWWQK